MLLFMVQRVLSSSIGDAGGAADGLCCVAMWYLLNSFSELYPRHLLGIVYSCSMQCYAFCSFIHRWTGNELVIFPGITFYYGINYILVVYTCKKNCVHLQVVFTRLVINAVFIRIVASITINFSLGCGY